MPQLFEKLKLSNISFKYKIFIPFVVILFIGGAIYNENKKVSNYLKSELISINKQNIQLSSRIATISDELSSLKDIVILKTLDENIEDKDLTKAKNVIKDINRKLEALKNDSLIVEQNNTKDIDTLKKRINGYFSILLTFPDEYAEDKEDALIAIYSLEKVNVKVKEKIDSILKMTRDRLSSRLITIETMINHSEDKFKFIMFISLLVLFLTELFIVKEILYSLKLVSKLNKSFADYLTKKSDNVIQYEVFSQDEIGEILKSITKNISHAEKLINKDRILTNEIENINTNLVVKLQNSLKEIKELNIEIEDTQREVIFTMGSIGESRSKETGNHVRRVSEYSALLGKLYGLDEREIELLRDASAMHDIGKVAIPDRILKKPGKLTDEEFVLMKTHAELGYNMLNHSQRPIFKAAAIIAHQHHEKYNGKGYPRGLKGMEIHIYGLITAIADVFDALGSDRVYKKAWPLEKILNLLKEERGEHFHPTLIDLFLENIDQFLEIRDKYKDILVEEEHTLEA